MSIDDSDWDRQRCFLAVVRTGSLSGAARSLGVAQPTVRRRVADLEAALGTALFTRAPSGLVPTDLALTLVGHAEAMAHAAAAFDRSASAPADALAGAVRITASEVIAVEVLPGILAPLRSDHPALTLVLSASNRNEDVLRREADVAVRMARPAQDGLVARKVGTVRLGLFARADYLAAHGTPARIGEVVAHGLIGPEHDTDVLRGLRADGFDISPADFAVRADSDVAQLAAIRAGLGIGVCQVALARRDPALVAVLPDAFAFTLEAWVVAHEDQRGVARIRAVFDRLADGMADYCKLSA